MLFDDDFFQLTGISSGETKTKSNNGDEKKESASKSDATADKSADLVSTQKTTSLGVPINNEFSNADGDYVIESDLVTPTIKAVKDETQKPLIVACDDDFDTLDLLTIYLSRNYRYEAFSGPKEAIFFLNQNIPELILLDCRIHTMKATTFMEIVRAGIGDVNFAYLGTEEELAAIDKSILPEYVIGFLKKPVPRGELQDIIDLVIKK